jgi:hypothetical protein
MKNDKIENLIIEALRAEGKKIVPPRELLENIVRNSIVTKKEAGRYLNGTDKVRLSPINSMFNWKIFVGAGALMTITSLLIIAQAGIKIPSAEISGPPTSFSAVGKVAEEKTIQGSIADSGVVAPVSVDNVDETVNAILSDSLTEDEALAGEDAEAVLADADYIDNKVIDNFIQIYDQN